MELKLAQYYGEISDRIFECLAVKDITDSEFAKDIGVSRQHVSLWRNKKANMSAAKILTAVMIYPDMNQEFIFHGTGQKITKSNVLLLEELMEAEKTIEKQIKQIDLLEREKVQRNDKGRKSGSRARPSGILNNLLRPCS